MKLLYITDQKLPRKATDTDQFYTGVAVVEISEKRVDQFYKEEQLQLTAEELENHTLYPNQIVVIKNTGVDGKTTKSALPWTKELLELKEIIENKTGEKFNSCLLNLYHNGDEGMAWHSDGEKSLLH